MACRFSEIARRTNLSRYTIKEWLRQPLRSEMKYRRLSAPKKIRPFETALRRALESHCRAQRAHRRLTCSGAKPASRE
jgi:hypothetical protein